MKYCLLFLTLFVQINALAYADYKPTENYAIKAVHSINIPITKNGLGDDWATLFEDGRTEHRNPDRTGNLFESLDRMDRKYAKGGQLLKTDRWEYKYDQEGNLVRKKDKGGQVWRYEWNDAGMLSKVKRPDSMEVTFKYDALGRRIEKCFNNRIFTKWLWDGNVPLHEQKESRSQDYQNGRACGIKVDRQPLTTWVFEEGTFVPAAKLTEHQRLSIVTNYLGTPEAMHREDGEEVWTCELNSYGKVRKYEGLTKTECPFRYQGQYEDAETGLYYNRFRYYSPDEGMYINQDPIRLEGGFKLYNYVNDPNGWLDVLGLTPAPKDLPNTSGIYIVTNDVTGEAYVGLGGSGEKQGMRDRLGSTSDPGNILLGKEGTIVRYVEVTGLEGKSRVEKNRILRVFEKEQHEKYKKKYAMLNSETTFLGPKKLKDARKAIKDGNIKQKRTKVCKQ